MGVMAGMGAVTAAVGFLKIPKLCDKWFEHEQWYTAQWGIAIMFASAAGALVLGTLVCCALAGTGEVQARNSQVRCRGRCAAGQWRRDEAENAPPLRLRGLSPARPPRAPWSDPSSRTETFFLY